MLRISAVTARSPTKSGGPSFVPLHAVVGASTLQLQRSFPVAALGAVRFQHAPPEVDLSGYNATADQGRAGSSPPPKKPKKPFRLLRRIVVGGSLAFLYWGLKNDEEDAEVLRAALMEVDALRPPNYVLPAVMAPPAGAGSSGRVTLLSEDPSHAHVDVTERLPTTGEELVTRTVDCLHDDRIVHVCVMFKKDAVQGKGKGKARAVSRSTASKPAVVINAGTIAGARPLALALRRRDPDLTIISYTHAGLINQPNLGWDRPKPPRQQQQQGKAAGDGDKTQGQGQQKTQQAQSRDAPSTVTPLRPSSPRASTSSSTASTDEVLAVRLTTVAESGTSLAAAALEADGMLTKALPIGDHEAANLSEPTRKLLRWLKVQRGRAPWDQWVEAQVQHFKLLPGGIRGSFDPLRHYNPLSPVLLGPYLSAVSEGDDNPLYTSYFTSPVTAPDALATSDWESSELSAVLGAAARVLSAADEDGEDADEEAQAPSGEAAALSSPLSAGIVLIANHHNWLATVKTALRNPERVRGLVLLDPQMPTFTPYLGVHTGTGTVGQSMSGGSTASEAANRPSPSTTSSSSSSSATTSSSSSSSSFSASVGLNGVQVAIGAPAANSKLARPMAVFTPAPFLLELPPHRSLAPGVLRNWSSLKGPLFPSLALNGSSDAQQEQSQSQAQAQGQLLESGYEPEAMLSLETALGLGYYLTDRMTTMEPLSGAQLMDAVVARQLIAGSALGPLGSLPAHAFLRPKALSWLNKGNGSGVASFPALAPSKRHRYEFICANPLDGHGKHIPLMQSPYLHLDLVAAGAQSDVNKVWFPFFSTGEGMKDLRGLMIESTAQAVGAALRHNTNAALARIQAGMIGAGAVTVDRAIVTEGTLREAGQKEEGSGTAKDDDEEDNSTSAASSASVDGGGEGTLLFAPALYSSGERGLNSVVVSASPSTDDVVRIDEAPADHLAVAALGPNFAYRVNFRPPPPGEGGSETTEQEKEEKKQLQQRKPKQEEDDDEEESEAFDEARKGTGVSDTLGNEPDLLAFPVNAQLDTRYQWLHHHLDSGLSENFLHSLVSSLCSTILTPPPAPLGSGGASNPHVETAKRLTAIANALGLMKGQDSSPLQALRRKGKELAAKTRPVAFGTVPLQAASEDEALTVVSTSLLTPEQRDAFANVMVTTLAALAFPDSKFARAKPLLSRKVGALERGAVNGDNGGDGNGSWGSWLFGSGGSKDTSSSKSEGTSEKAVLLPPAALLLGCDAMGLSFEGADKAKAKAEGQLSFLVDDNPETALRALALEAVLSTPPQMALTLSHAGVDVSKLLLSSSGSSSKRAGDDEDDGWTVEDAAKALSRRLLHSPGTWLLPVLRVSLARCLASITMDAPALKYRDPAVEALEREILKATDSLVARYAAEEDDEDEVVRGSLLDTQDKAVGEELAVDKRLLAISAMPTFHGRASLLTGKPGRQSTDYLIVNSLEDALHGLALRRATLEPYRLQAEVCNFAMKPQLVMAYAALIDRYAGPGDVGADVDLNNPRDGVAVKAAAAYRKAVREAALFEAEMANKLTAQLDARAMSVAMAAGNGQLARLAAAGSGSGYRAGLVTNSRLAAARTKAIALLSATAAEGESTPVVQQYQTAGVRRAAFRSSVAGLGLMRFLQANLTPPEGGAPFPLRVIITQQTQRRAMEDPLLGPPQVLSADAKMLSSIGSIGKVPQELRLAMLSKQPPPATVAARIALGAHQAQMRELWSELVRPQQLLQGTVGRPPTPGAARQRAALAPRVLVVAPETGAEVQASLRAASALLKAGTSATAAATPVAPSNAAGSTSESLPTQQTFLPKPAVRTLLLKNDGGIALGGRYTSDVTVVQKEAGKVMDALATSAASAGAKGIERTLKKVSDVLQPAESKDGEKGGDAANPNTPAAASDASGVPPLSGFRLASTKPPPVFLLGQDLKQVKLHPQAQAQAHDDSSSPVTLPADCMPVVSGAAFSDALTLIADALAYGAPQPYRPPVARVVTEVLDLVQHAQREMLEEQDEESA